MSENLDWNYDEFCTFLLIHAAYSDLEFTEEEKKLILSMVNQETFKKIESHYLTLSDFECLQTILDYKGLYYPTVAQKDELLGRVKQLFSVDGEYTRLEKNLMMFFDKLL